jgi:hypothetical protein
MNLSLPASYIARLISLFAHLFTVMFYRAKKLLNYNRHLPCFIPFVTVVIIILTVLYSTVSCCHALHYLAFRCVSENGSQTACYFGMSFSCNR